MNHPNCKISWAPLTEVAPLVVDRVKPFKGTKQFLSTGGLNDNIINLETVTYENRPSRADLGVQQNDVICARMKDTNKVLLITSETSDLIISTGFAVHRPNIELIDPSYLFHYLRTKYFQEVKNKYCTGATQKAVTNDGLKQIKIPLVPSIIQQKKIGTILDKADAIKRKRQRVLKFTDELLRSAFLDMFGDPVTNPKEWGKAPIQKLGFVITGNTPSREHPEYYGRGIEWIKSDNINTPYHFLTKAKEFLTPEGQKIGRIVPEKSILVTCIAGSPDCIGNAALADRPVAFNQQINAVTPFEDTDPFFLYVHFLVSKKLVQQQSTESMKGMVNKSKFENILFLKPPYSLQRNFGKIFNRIHNAFSRSNNSMSLSEDLFNALTQKAFRGELE
jgi:type I restriction enzyme S subunit